MSAHVNTLSWYWDGNCVNSFDDDGNCLLDIFVDVSDFAVALEDTVMVEKPKLISAPFSDEEVAIFKFCFNEARNVLIGYDEDMDIHHFFTTF